MSDKNKLILKEDINFLEFPDWIVSERGKIKEYMLEKDNGTYKMTTAADSLPNRFDKIVLYFLLFELFNNNRLNSSEIKTTRYKVTKSVYYNTKNICKANYKRIMLSLKRWGGIFIEFDGVFYNGDNYTKRFFHIIDNIKLDLKTKELYIKFNDDYIKQLQESNFYKYIDFNEYKKLIKPVAARLYEILIKTFKGRQTWKIHIQKLTEKLTLNEKYPSQILKKLIAAINEINKKTELQIKLQYNKESQICAFAKIETPEPKKAIESENPQLNLLESTSPTPKKHEEELKKCLDRLPETENKQKSIQTLIEKYLKQKGFDYTMSNIVYTIKNANKNFKYYLEKSLKNDYGKDIRAEFQAKKEIAEVEKKRKEEEDRKNKEKEERKQKEKKELLDFYDTLSEEEQKVIDKKIEESLSPHDKKRLKQCKASNKEIPPLTQGSINYHKFKILKDLQDDKEAQTKKTKPTPKKALEINQETRKQGNIKEQIKNEFNTTVENKIKEIIKNFTPQQKESATQNFKRELKKEGRLGEIILKTLETKGIKNPTVKIHFENFIGKNFLPENYKDFYLWVENKGYNLKDVI